MTRKNPITLLEDLRSTLDEVRSRLELAEEQLQNQEERRYVKRLRSLDTEEGIRRLRERAEAEGKDLATAANEFVGTPPKPLPPRTPDEQLDRYALEADTDLSVALGAERELLEHIAKTREEVE